MIFSSNSVRGWGSLKRLKPGIQKGGLLSSQGCFVLVDPQGERTDCLMYNAVAYTLG